VALLFILKFKTMKIKIVIQTDKKKKSKKKFYPETFDGKKPKSSATALH
jgi:hypothetical protein